MLRDIQLLLVNQRKTVSSLIRKDANVTQGSAWYCSRKVVLKLRCKLSSAHSSSCPIVLVFPFRLTSFPLFFCLQSSPNFVQD